MKNDILRFVQLDRESKSFLNRDDLLAIPEFAVNPLAERIVDLFMPVEKENKCNFAEFCFMLAHFQPTNEETPDEMPNSGLVFNSLPLNRDINRQHNRETCSKTSLSFI